MKSLQIQLSYHFFHMSTEKTVIIDIFLFLFVLFLYFFSLCYFNIFLRHFRCDFHVIIHRFEALCFADKKRKSTSISRSFPEILPKPLAALKRNGSNKCAGEALPDASKVLRHPCGRIRHYFRKIASVHWQRASSVVYYRSKRKNVPKKRTCTGWEYWKH